MQLPQFRHYKTGGTYEVITEAILESNPAVLVVVYRNIESGKVWCRPRDEFYGQAVQGTTLVPRFVRLWPNGLPQDP